MPQDIISCTCVQEAWETFERTGACILDLQIPELVLDNLYEWCVANAQWWEQSGSREDGTTDPALTKRRFSINSWRHLSDVTWLQLASHLFDEKCPLVALLDLLMGRRMWLSCVFGGDVVRAHTPTRQAVHGDGTTMRPQGRSWSDQLDWSPWLALSVAVHDIGPGQAPILFVGRENMFACESATPPAWGTEPTAWHDKVVPLSKGQVLLRDVRVWHAGTPNLTESDRFLPAMQIWHKAEARRRHATMPDGAWDKLSYSARPAFPWSPYSECSESMSTTCSSGTSTPA